MDSPFHQSAFGNECSVNMILQALNLEKYQPLFSKKGLPLEAFVSLSSSDLECLGITDDGDKNKILESVKHFRNTNKDSDVLDEHKVIGNTVHQLYMISARMTNLRKKLNIHPRPRNTLVESSISTTTAIMDFLIVIKDQLDYTKSDLLSALPKHKKPAHVFYFRRAVAIGVLTLIVYGLFRRK